MSHQGRILVVDDEPRWLEPLSHVLTSAGYDVRAVNGGEPALASVADGLPDLILLDIRMPGIGGFEVLKRFKERAETRDIPILLLSAFAEVDERIEGLKLGAVDSVTKPFHAGELLARVRMQMELRRLRAEHAAQTAALKIINEKLESEIALHKRTEAELRRNEDRLRFALQTMSAGAWELDLVDHTAHRTLLHDRIFGYETTLPAWTYEMFLEHVLPEDRAEVDRCFRWATETHSDWGFECRIRRTDGVVRWIWAAGAHERNAEAKPVRMAGIVQDITDRHMAEVALRENEANLTITLNSIGDAVLATDAEGRITRMNPVAERLTGWPLAEAEGRPMGEVFRIVNAQTRKPAVNPVEQVIARGVTLGLANHTVLLARDGREFQIADSAAPIRDQSGTIVGVVLVFSDVTERYKTDARIVRLTQLYAALSQCNQAIVHSSSMEELVPKICRDVVESGGLRMAWIGLVDEGTGAVCPVASYGEGTDYLKEVKASTDAREARGRGPTGTSIRENRPVWCQDFQNDPTTEPWHEPAARFGWMSVAALPLRSGGKPVGALVVYSDKTGVFDEEVRGLLEEMADDVSFALDGFDNEAERQRAEEALIESERDLSRAQAIAHLGSWSWDIVADRISWSDEMFRIYGVDPAAFDARVEGLARLIHPEDLWKQECAIRDSLAGLPGQPFDYRVMRPDGTERVVEVSSVQLDVDPEGRPLRMFGVAQDITERKKAEDALRESEERFRLMLQHIPSISVQGYYMDGRTHYWNDASEVLYGYSGEEAIGKNLLDLIIPPEMREGVRQAIETMGQTLQPIPASELTLMRKDGSRVPVYSSHAVVARHGREPELFCIDIDLTERKRAEEVLRDLNRHLEEETVRAEQLAVEAQAAARAKSEFLALMSHELRTPLNGVIGFAELLSGTRLDEEQEEFTKTIIDCGTHLLDLVNDILDFSSIEKGRMQIESAPILVAALVESSCSPIRKLAADKGLEFSCVIAPDVPEEITGDIRRIRQILINLLGNAIKFARRGSVVLEIAPSSLDGRPALDFSVEDTGPGIVPEMIGYLFKPFTQADSTVSRQFEGTGLGLAISLRLAEAMGGTLGVVSTPGEGSRFTFRFPLRDGAPAPSNKGSGDASSSPDEKDGATWRPLAENPVLVVEDDQSSRILAGKMLEHLGCRAEFAANGQEAVDAFAPEKFSAILMDMQMPVIDGLEATIRIRERESGARVPIIALTANVMPGDRERCLAAGMDDVLTKPFKMTELSAMLARFLRP